MDNARDFNLQLDAEFAAMFGSVKEAMKVVATEGLALAQEGSPVDTGQFRANWVLSVGEPNGAIFPADAGNSGAVAAETAALSQGALAETDTSFPVIYLQNNLPYASRLEDGHSGQAPNGVLGLVAAEIAASWENYVL